MLPRVEWFWSGFLPLTSSRGEDIVPFRAMVLAVLLLVAVPLAAQDSPTGPEAPAARLDDWLGSWISEVGGFECDRFGASAVVCRSHWLTETGERGQGLYLNRWDDVDEVFRSYRFYDTGGSGSGFMWVDGDTWTSVFEGPKGARDKAVWTLSEEAAEYALYRSVRGGPWEYVYTISYRRASEGDVP